MIRKQRSSAAVLAAVTLVGVAALMALSNSAAPAQQPESLQVAAPELVGGPWLNTPKNAPIKLADRKGKVTLVEFWTFG